MLPPLHPGAEGRTDASSCICGKSKSFPRISLRAFAQTVCTNIPETAYPCPTPGFGATVSRVRLQEHSALLTCTKLGLLVSPEDWKAHGERDLCPLKSHLQRVRDIEEGEF